MTSKDESLTVDQAVGMLVRCSGYVLPKEKADRLIAYIKQLDYDLEMAHGPSGPPAVETTRELSSSESASFDKALAHSPRRVEPARDAVTHGCPVHGECPVCKSMRIAGDPRQSVSVAAVPTLWSNAVKTTLNQGESNG